MKETKVNWKPEDNSYINKVFEILNLVLGFSVILAPIITSLFCLIGINMEFLKVLLMIYIIFLITSLASFFINIRFFKFRKLDILEILGIALFFMLCVTEIINRPIALNFFFTLGYFFIFLIFIKIDKKYYRALMYTFVLMMAVCSIMGVCDLNNSYMPGFLEYTFPMSMQFFNPNYSGYITTMSIILCIYILSKYKTKTEQIIFWTAYVVLNVALFINGCFAAETAMFVGELFLLIYFWIKNKKCPWLILICMLISIASSFVWIKGYSTSGANYMFESLAVIDNNLGTTLVKDVSTFFDKLFGTGIIDGVLGSDGWDRADAKKVAFQMIFDSPKSVFFGYGITYNNNVLVHNVILQIWLEYGVINLLLYSSIIVILIVRMFRTKFSLHNMFLFAVMLAEIGICHYFGGLNPYSFVYYVCLLAVSMRGVNEKFKEKQAEQKLAKQNDKLISQKNQERKYGM